MSWLVTGTQPFDQKLVKASIKENTKLHTIGFGVGNQPVNVWDS